MNLDERHWITADRDRRRTPLATAGGQAGREPAGVEQFAEDARPGALYAPGSARSGRRCAGVPHGPRLASIGIRACVTGIGATRPEGYTLATLDQFRAGRERRMRRNPGDFDAAARRPECARSARPLDSSPRGMTRSLQRRSHRCPTQSARFCSTRVLTCGR